VAAVRPELQGCACPACAQLAHRHAGDDLLLFAVAVAVVVAGLVWLTGQVGGLLAAHSWPDVPAAAVPGVLARLPRRLDDPAGAWPASVRAALPGPAGMYATLALLLAVPVGLAALVPFAPPSDRALSEPGLDR
jgi:hypothetical protein